MVETDPFNEDPSVIGYWARVHGFKLEDLLYRDDTRPNPVLECLGSADAQRQFREGWDQADHELREERMGRLMASLREAYYRKDENPRLQRA